MTLFLESYEAVYHHYIPGDLQPDRASNAGPVMTPEPEVV